MADNKPAFIAYSVRDFQKEDGQADASWVRIGAMWPNKDGKGFNLTLDALPLTGKIVLRANEPKPAKS